MRDPRGGQPPLHPGADGGAGELALRTGAGPPPVRHRQTRYSQREAAATVEPLPGGCIRMVFTEPQRAVTPGQAVVFYDGDLVLGGGTICP